MSILEKKKKNKAQGYKPILSGMRDWPVYQLSKNRKEFIGEVVERAVTKLLEAYPSKKGLLTELETCVYRELNRIKRNRWKVDPPDDRQFWNGLKDKLEALKSEEGNDTTKEADIFRRIVQRYANEIAGTFKTSSYKIAREVITFGFARLLNSAQVKSIRGFFSNRYSLRDKMQIVGKTGMLRKLARKGTVVMVPTHFSNIDSVLIGWVIHTLGLPAFIYGAGLNLFNIKILAYFMSSLGAYKVDRRRKNVIYFETLKTYSTNALMKGVHSLFFPGGGRSRSGAIEQVLKKGLLGSAIETQRNLYLESKEKPEKKIFIVPVTINTHFVLEAPELIEDYLQAKGKENYVPENAKYGSLQLIRFLFKFFTKGSNISVSIGPAMDVIGNYVDEEGHSLDQQKRVIHTKDYFISGGEVCIDLQREAEYSRILSQRIVDEYYRINRVFSSHLAAFVVFEIWQKKYSMLDLFSFLRLPEENFAIDYEAFKTVYLRVHAAIITLKHKNKVHIASDFKDTSDAAIKSGISNVGIFHLNRPLLCNKKGKIVTQDLTLLYYYHNRLTGYNLERYI